jgi:hypothetical protein
MAACNGLIGLSEPTVAAGGADASGAEADVETPEAAATADAGGAEAGADPDAAPAWPARCALDAGDACPDGLHCDPNVLLCAKACDPSTPCPSGSACFPIQPPLAPGDCIGGDYECIGNVKPETPTAPSIRLTFTFHDTSTGAAPAAGATVRVCARADAACSSPVATVVTDATGSIDLQIPTGTTGFDGYLDITGPSTSGEPLQETLFYFGRPLVRDSLGSSWTLSSESSLQSYWPATMDPARAQLMIVAGACYGTPAFGASIDVSTADAQTVFDVFGPQGPLQAQTFVPVVGNALAYVANVPGPSATVTTRYRGNPVGSMEVVLRPGVLVTGYLGPTP